MRRVILAAGLCVLAGLAACDSSKPAEVAASPPPPKSMARSQQMYQGQEMIAKIDTADISIRSPTVLDMHVAGSVGMAGYKNAAFLPRINAAPPKDGVYEVDVVADKPASPGAAAVTPIEVKKAWSPFPAEHLKGVKFFSQGNSVAAMLPPPKP
jgi:hypothetical protein